MQAADSATPHPADEATTRPAADDPPATRAERRARRRRGAADGQVLVIFALSIFVLVGLMAIVIDVSWYWANTLRVQRAADAAALAGVVDLPGNVPAAQTAAADAAAQNGYTLTNSCSGNPPAPTSNPGICAHEDSANDRQLDVTLTAPVSTFFMRLVGITSITATRSSKAEYILPVPMGSPLNYLGVGCFKTPSGTEPTCTKSGQSNGASGIPDASVVNPSPLTGPTAKNQVNSQGFFDGVETKGSQAGYGDAYGPANDPGRGGTNPTYNPAGVYYEVLIPAGDSNGSVYVFDPGFCSVDGSGNNGVGDHWIGGSGPVSTYYNLWNTNGNVYDQSQYTLVTASNTQFQDQSGQDSALGGSRGHPCDAYHDKWWRMTTGLAPGLYYLQVTPTKVLTTQPAADGGQVADPAGASFNQNTNAENMYSLEVTVGSGATTPQVFGAGKMVAYNNVVGGDQKFYLAQVPKIDAGKTLEIDLFDVGDVGGQAILYIESPDGNKYTNATFNFTADSLCANTCSGTNATSITATTSSGAHPYNDSWLTILIPLPSTYGSTGLTPSGETQAGWWKIDYQIASGVQSNDTTTWRVGVRGNPVHLIVP